MRGFDSSRLHNALLRAFDRNDRCRSERGEADEQTFDGWSEDRLLELGLGCCKLVEHHAADRSEDEPPVSLGIGRAELREGGCDGAQVGVRPCARRRRELRPPCRLERDLVLGEEGGPAATQPSDDVGSEAVGQGCGSEGIGAELGGVAFELGEILACGVLERLREKIVAGSEVVRGRR